MLWKSDESKLYHETNSNHQLNCNLSSAVEREGHFGDRWGHAPS